MRYDNKNFHAPAYGQFIWGVIISDYHYSDSALYKCVKCLLSEPSLMVHTSLSIFTFQCQLLCK